MGFAGLVFAAVGVLWLLYLVPLFLNRDSNGLLDEVEPGEPITSTVTIVRRGVPLDPELEVPADLATASGRARALARLDAAQADAAKRRAVVLGFLLLANAAVGVSAVLGAVPRWSVLVPLGALGAFVAAARFMVVRLHAELDAQAAVIRRAAETQVVEVETQDAPDASAEHDVDLTAPVAAVASLWDPVPITKPTYVSKPLASRTVRTIDLSAPARALEGGIPVTADAPAHEQPAALGLAANQ